MKSPLSYAVIMFLAMANFALAASEKDTIAKKERAAWQSFQDKKSDVFRKLLSDDLRCVYSDGIKTVDQEVASLGKSHLKSFSFSDMNVAFPDKDTALVTYKVAVRGTIEGKDATGSYYSASVWHNGAGGWRAIFHTQVKAE